MSQHNIIGSEAFSTQPYVLVRNVRAGGFRRRRSRSLLAYGVVTVLALSAGAAAAAFALGPLMFETPPAAATADARQPSGALQLSPIAPVAPAS